MALLRSVLQDRGTAKVLAVQAAYDVVTYGLYVFRVGDFCSFFFFFLSSFFLLLSPVSASIFLFHFRLFLLLLLAAVLPFPAVLLVPALFFLLLFFLRCFHACDATPLVDVRTLLVCIIAALCGNLCR